jgi:hypothetical protein
MNMSFGVGPNPNIVNMNNQKPQFPQKPANAPNKSVNFEGKTVHEAIVIQALEKGLNVTNLKIDKLKGKFPKDEQNLNAIVADRYKIGNNEYFKFQVEWEVKISGLDEPIKFKQDIFTNVLIPHQSSTKFESAKTEAFEIAKSYELIQKNLVKKPDSFDDTAHKKQIDALKTNNQISFQKIFEDAAKPESSRKLKVFEATSYGTNTPLYLTADKTDKITGAVFAGERFARMSTQTIILAGTSKDLTVESIEPEVKQQQIILKTEFDDLSDQFTKTENALVEHSKQFEGKGKKTKEEKDDPEKINTLENLLRQMEIKIDVYDKSIPSSTNVLTKKSESAKILDNMIISFNKQKNKLAEFKETSTSKPLNKSPKTALNSASAKPAQALKPIQPVKDLQQKQKIPDISVKLVEVKKNTPVKQLKPLHYDENSDIEESSTEYFSLESDSDDK